MNTTHISIQEATTQDRFQACLFISLIIHMLIIFGIIFKEHQKKTTPYKTLEITLANKKSDNPIQNADYFAQYNQQAGGKKEVKVQNQTPQLGILPTASIPVPTEIPTFQKKQPQTNEKLNVVDTQHSKFEEAITHHSPNKSSTKHALRSTNVENNRLAQIAAISAKVSKLQLAQAKRLKRRTISVATHESRDAEYLDYWRKKIEYVGNINYPGEARRQSLHGELRLLVAINIDGSVQKVEVRQSSGSKVLDDAAIQIVKLASPFPPLPKEIRKDTGILEIIRTWEFTNGKVNAVG